MKNFMIALQTYEAYLLNILVFGPRGLANKRHAKFVGLMVFSMFFFFWKNVTILFDLETKL